MHKVLTSNDLPYRSSSTPNDMTEIRCLYNRYVFMHTTGESTRGTCCWQEQDSKSLIVFQYSLQNIGTDGPRQL